MEEEQSLYTFPPISEKFAQLPFLAVTVGKANQNKVFRNGGIEHHQFLFTLSGEGKAIINGKVCTVEPNTLLYLAPFSQHCYEPTMEPWSVYWITFIQSFTLFSESSGIFRLEDVKICAALTEEMLKLNPNVLYTEQASVILYKLILEVNHQLENTSYIKSTHRLQAAMNYINKSYCSDIELSTLSELCGLSDEYFCRLFKKTYGVTAFSYIRTLKIQEAKKRLLLYNKQSLFQIAESVGYHTMNYFVTDFKKQVGMTPTEFRRYHSGN